MRRIRTLALALMALAAACSKAPTEVRIQEPTPSPTPAPILDMAGKWTGTMISFSGSERVEVSIEQNGAGVHATWPTAHRGNARFDGSLSGDRTKPHLSGGVTVERPNHCEMWPIRVGGDASASSVTLEGSTFWCFDPAPFTLELLRSVPR
jgi:hypothetical protein